MPTQAQFAKHWGISTPAVNDLMARGVVPRDATLEAGCLCYTAHLREKAAGRDKPDGDELTFEKTRLTKAQADKTELEVATLRGELIPAGEVESTWCDITSTIRTRLLSLPSRATTLMLAADSMQEAEAILKSLIREVLTELAADGTKDDPSEISELLKPSASAGPDDQPVGGRKLKAKPRR